MGYLRFLLALAVVLHHTPGAPYLFSGSFAVELFFSISGFYMALILEKKYAGKLYIFYTNRLYRLLPTYYFALMLAACALAFDASDHIPLASMLEAMSFTSVWPILVSNLTLIGQEIASFYSWSPDLGGLYGDPAQVGAQPAWRLLLIPQAWSVSLEIMFYVVAPFVVQKSRIKILILLIAASFLLKMAIIHVDVPYNSWGRRIFPSIMYFFFLGILAHHLMEKYRSRIEKVERKTVLGIFAIMLAILYLTRHAGPREFMLIYPFITVFCIALLPLLFLKLRSKFETLVGDLSYPMYLLHTIWVGVLMKTLHLQGYSLGAAVVIATIASAYGVYRFIDRPVDAFRQRRASASKPAVLKVLPHGDVV